ncbi:MAG TPA: cupin domain-containing protein [Candidatus Polarisedimenticolaceae bacterium]|nr:cupin domain-containing protein [Candidatus Polarisedimenticolaceae bacterium]
MIKERDGWFVVNVKDARWTRRGDFFGPKGSFERPGDPFPQVGIHVYVLEPGKPNCRYHREEAQEDLLVLSGRCRLLANGEERLLETWDFVHFPAGVSHVVVGMDEPAAVLFIGHRQDPEPALFYPASDLARRYGAEAPEPTEEPAVAYSDTPPRAPSPPPRWPVK